jgi:hypothetical protein
MAQFMADVQSSVKARDSVGGDFKLATCGWELNGGFLDSHDPQHVLTALSTLDRGLGFADTDQSLANVTNHAKWSIPWLEDDMGLIGAELWADRTLCHARKAATLGVTGLMGIHCARGVSSPIRHLNAPWFRLKRSSVVCLVCPFDRGSNPVMALQGAPSSPPSAPERSPPQRGTSAPQAPTSTTTGR